MVPKKLPKAGNLLLLITLIMMQIPGYCGEIIFTYPDEIEKDIIKGFYQERQPPVGPVDPEDPRSPYVPLYDGKEWVEELLRRYIEGRVENYRKNEALKKIKEEAKPKEHILIRGVKPRGKSSYLRLQEEYKGRKMKEERGN